MGSRRFGQWKKLQYQVWWKGYSTAHNSWELAEGVHAPKLMKDFKEWQKDKSRAMSNELLLSSLTLITINTIIVSQSSFVNNLETALIEEVALQVM